MVESEDVKFVYGEISKTKDFNWIVESVNFNIYNFEFNDFFFLVDDDDKLMVLSH